MHKIQRYSTAEHAHILQMWFCFSHLQSEKETDNVTTTMLVGYAFVHGTSFRLTRTRTQVHRRLSISRVVYMSVCVTTQH